MSTCWRCGRTLPGTSTECEDGCRLVALQIDQVMLDALDSEACAGDTLDGELIRGQAAAQALAEHLHRMGAERHARIVYAQGAQYVVFVKRIKGGHS